MAMNHLCSYETMVMLEMMDEEKKRRMIWSAGIPKRREAA
jgi:hypothetical protein